MTFDEAIETMTEISIFDLEERITKGEDMIAFIGRPTCPYCQLFVPKLAQVVNETGVKVSYLESDNVKDASEIAAFRETYTIPTVPALLEAKAGEVHVVCDSSLSVEAIKDFIA
ncbi:thioredoxin [Streptococcus sciuri]